jgi:hypothetical protein
MTISDQLHPSNSTARLRAVTSPSPAELHAADRLLCDLAALVDAGLVVVRRRPGGAARYAAVSEPGGAE